MEAKRIYFANGGFTLVDADDFEELNQHRWSGPHYAMRSEKGTTVYMHRVIAKPPKGLVVDHINDDPLDNRKENLRVCTQGQNLWNMKARTRNVTSKYRGVGLDRHGRWRAEIKVDSFRRSKAGIHSEVEAARYYDKFAEKYYGEYARLNRDMFPEDFA